MKRNIVLLTLILSISAHHASGQLELSAEFRPRFELNFGHGQVPRTGQIPTTFVSQRTRFNVKHQSNSADLFFSLQDVRVWGDDNLASRISSQMNSSGVGIFQAWMGFGLGQKDYLRIGRQEFSYDDQRLLSGRNWPQYGQTYDAILWRHTNRRWTVDVALSYNNDATKLGSGFGNNHFLVDPIENRIRTLNFLYAKRQFGAKSYLSGLAILSGYQKDKQSNVIYMMATLGGHLNSQTRLFDLKANYYVQRGKSQKGKDMQSFFATAEARWKQGRLKPGFGFDVVSGNDATNNSQDYAEREHSFDLLYGIRYLRYGRLNQYILPSSTAGGGWVDFYPALTFETGKHGTFTAEWFFFSLHQPVRNPLNNGQILKGSLGNEINLIWSHNLRSDLNLNVGFARYQANDTYALVKGLQPEQLAAPYYGWVMLTFKPILFKSAK